MKKLFIKEFRQPIYPIPIWVAITSDMDALSAYFNDGTTFPDEPIASCTCVLRKRRNTQEAGIVIQFENSAAATIKIIAHEATHAAGRIFERIGAEMSSDEPFAYLVGYIAECCEKAVQQFSEIRKYEKVE